MSRSGFSPVLVGALCSLALASIGCGGRVDPIPPPGAGEPSGSGSGSASATSSGSSGSGGSGGGTCKAAPACEPGDEPVASESGCLADGICYTRTSCGKTIWCTGPGDDHCDAVPTCPTGSIEVKTCPGSADCTTVTVCGTTIQCMMSCEGPEPICDPGDKQVASPSECLQDDAVCYARSTCGYTIWCTGPAN